MNNRLISTGIVSLVMIAGLVGFIEIGSENAQGTDVSGMISSDTTWDLAGSPYIVVGDVTVADGVTLTIEAGVQVKFDGFYSMYVDGTLIAIGMETNRINITSNKATLALNDWDEIRINSTGYVEIKYSKISYGRSGISLVASSNNIITNNNITSNDQNGIYIFSASNNIIMDNSLSSNRCNGISLIFASNNIVMNNSVLSTGWQGIDGKSMYKLHKQPRFSLCILK